MQRNRWVPGSVGLYYSGTGAKSLTVASSGNLVSGFHTKVLAVHGATASAGS